MALGVRSLNYKIKFVDTGLSESWSNTREKGGLLAERLSLGQTIWQPKALSGCDQSASSTVDRLLDEAIREMAEREQDRKDVWVIHVKTRERGREA